jgi:hypothetical protein
VTAFPRLTPEDLGRYDDAEPEYMVLERVEAGLYRDGPTAVVLGPTKPRAFDPAMR